MLFIITQIHTPESCPADEGGRELLHEKPEKVPGLSLLAGYGAYTEHTLYYILEADDYKTVEKFLRPGLTRSDATITPVDHFFGE